LNRFHTAISGNIGFQAAIETAAKGIARVPDMKARSLTVMVDGWIIEDGSLAVPVVGQTLSVHLEFRRASSSGTADPRVSAHRAVAQPTPSREPGTDHSGRLWWQTMLRGDGWSAAWRADRPMIGHVEVTGIFYADYERVADEVRGMVTRVRVVTVGYTLGDRGFEPIPDGAARYTEVDTAPRWFDRGYESGTPEPGRSYDHQVGVLVDLDLAPAEPAPLRARIRPTAVSEHGSDLWVLDAQLPVLVHITDAEGAASATEHLLAAPVIIAPAERPVRRVFADADGCWVIGGSDVLRCTLVEDGTLDTRRYDLGRVRVAAAHEGLLLTAGDTVNLLRPGAEPKPVDLPVATTHSFAVQQLPERVGQEPSTVTRNAPSMLAAATTANGFVVLMQAVDAENMMLAKQFRLVRITADAHVDIGPAFDLERRPLMVGTSAGVQIFDRARVYEIADLTPVPRAPLPRPPLEAGSAGAHVWVTLHRPDGSGRGGWWPLRGPQDLPPPEAGQWLFVLLHPVTYNPVTVAPISTTRPDVTVGANGTVWIAGGGLRALHLDGVVTGFDVPSLLRDEW